jgi:hypothetical protein
LFLGTVINCDILNFSVGVFGLDPAAEQNHCQGVNGPRKSRRYDFPRCLNEDAIVLTPPQDD